MVSLSFYIPAHNPICTQKAIPRTPHVTMDDYLAHVEEKARTHVDALKYQPSSFADSFFPTTKLPPAHNPKLLGAPIDAHHGEEPDGETNVLDEGKQSPTAR